jgi:hypothetical protein
MAGSASRGMIEDRRPENFKLGSTLASGSGLASFSAGLPDAAAGGSICPGRTGVFVIVRGVANREILKVLTFGVTPRAEELIPFEGDPFSETFVGDCGRLAGD